MKKFILSAVLTLLSYISFAQVTVRGDIICIYNKKITDSGEHVYYDSSYPVFTRIGLTDEYLSVYNLERGFKYELSDKEVSKLDGKYVLSYTGRRKGKLKLIAVRELNCPNYIVIAILPFLSDETKYVEYLVKVRPSK